MNFPAFAFQGLPPELTNQPANFLWMTLHISPEQLIEH